MKRTDILPFLILAVVTGGCSKDAVAPEPAPTPVVWKQITLPSGRSDDDVLRLTPRSDDLFVLAQRSFTTLHGDGDFGPSWSVYVPIGLTRPFASRNYFVYSIDLSKNFGHNSLSINWSVNRGGIPAELQLPLSVLDPTLSEYARLMAGDNHTDVAVINDNDMMLVPVWDANPSGPSPPYLYLMKLNPRAPGDFSEITYSLEKRIDWPTVSVWVATAGNRFFASTVLATYGVSEDGTLTKLLEPGAHDLIEHDGGLFASTWKGVYASADGGATWEYAAYADLGTFFEVDGKLCILHPGSIEELDPGDGSATTLPHDGLPTGSLFWETAAQFGDRVYVGTRAGLFSKPVSEFFAPPTPAGTEKNL